MSDFTRRPYPHHLAKDGDDWLIRYQGGLYIARVSLDTRTQPHRWMWMTWTYDHRSGTAETLQDALQAVKDAVLALPPGKAREAHDTGRQAATGTCWVGP